MNMNTIEGTPRGEPTADARAKSEGAQGGRKVGRAVFGGGRRKVGRGRQAEVGEGRGK